MAVAYSEVTAPGLLDRRHVAGWHREELMDQAAGFILGVLASILAWYLLTRLRPRVAVAPKAAYQRETGRIRIKVINRGRRQVSDCRATLTLNERQREGDTLRIRIQHRLPLAREHLFALGPKTEFGKAWGLYPAFIFRASVGRPELLEQLVRTANSERRLVFTVAARDAISGSEIVLRTTYRAEDIQEGIYRTGDNFEIMRPCEGAASLPETEEEQ